MIDMPFEVIQEATATVTRAGEGTQEVTLTTEAEAEVIPAKENCK